MNETQFYLAKAVLSARKWNREPESVVRAYLAARAPLLNAMWDDPTLEAKVAEWSGDEWGRD